MVTFVGRDIELVRGTQAASKTLLISYLFGWVKAI